MVHLDFWSAVPCGPFYFLECTPMWSLLLFRVHSHLVLIAFKNALRSGPPYKYFGALVRVNIEFESGRVIQGQVIITDKATNPAWLKPLLENPITRWEAFHFKDQIITLTSRSVNMRIQNISCHVGHMTPVRS